MTLLESEGGEEVESQLMEVFAARSFLAGAPLFPEQQPHLPPPTTTLATLRTPI